MSDIELVIKIPEDTVDEIKDNAMFAGSISSEILWDVTSAIVNGIALPKGHGRLIDKDHMIVRLEAASKFYGGENADAFDERFSYGLKEAAIKVSEEPTIIEADTESEE
jgi:hypothetical protein